MAIAAARECRASVRVGRVPAGFGFMTLPKQERARSNTLPNAHWPRPNTLTCLGCPSQQERPQPWPRQIRRGLFRVGAPLKGPMSNVQAEPRHLPIGDPGLSNMRAPDGHRPDRASRAG
jgi:hypothetical protein